MKEGRIKKFLKKVRYRYQHEIGTDVLIERMAALTDIYIPASVKHREVFPKYENIYSGREIVITGTGPTFEYYKPIKDAIHIGINYAIYREDIEYDYLFSSDYCNGEEKEFFDFVYENKKNTIKFYLIQTNHSREYDQIPKFYCEQENVEMYYCDSYDRSMRGSIHEKRDFKLMFPLDLSVSPLKSYGTTMYLAFQFALWTRPKIIFLVGADCTTGYARGIKSDNIDDVDHKFMMEPWKELKGFAENYYPDVKVVSINPVGLKGLFEDEFTDSYLRDTKKRMKKGA